MIVVEVAGYNSEVGLHRPCPAKFKTLELI